MRMQPIAFAAVFAAAVTLSLSAAAQPTVQPSAGAASPAPLRASSMYKLTPDEARYLRGSYRLDDGRTLNVSSERSRLYADLDGRVEELVPVASHTFVARDSRTRFAFNEVPFAHEVVVTPSEQ